MVTTSERSEDRGSTGSRSCRRAFDRVAAQVARLLEISQSSERVGVRAADVSSWGVSQHLDHLARANHHCLAAIRELVASPEVEGADAGLNLVGRLVMFTGWIPRGRGRAPERTVPQAASLSEIRDSLGKLQTSLSQLEPSLGAVSAARGRTRHHVFGGLTSAQWLRFMAIHTHHHLKIIDDIERAQSS